MRTKSARFFECKVRYENKENELVAEVYAVEAYSFTEAEMAVVKGINPFGVDFDIKSLTIAPYSEVSSPTKIPMINSIRYAVISLPSMKLTARRRKLPRTTSYRLIRLRRQERTWTRPCAAR